MTEVLLRAQGIKKNFRKDLDILQILHGLDFEIHKGESVAIVGGSGAGKSTLLQILGTLDLPTEGQVFFRGQNVTQWSDHELAKFRNENLGFVFQFHHLLQEFTALENVMLPCLIQKMPYNLAKEKAAFVLSELGLQERLEHYPSQLSGGDSQICSFKTCTYFG
jgi:lipoprotein-releasing system ATP-binding protein